MTSQTTPSLASMPLDEAQTVQHILAHCRTVAVVGLSAKPHRASFDVSRYMQAQGWRIIPVNPNATTVLGEKAHPTLSEAARHARIDLVNVFRNSDDVRPLAETDDFKAVAEYFEEGAVLVAFSRPAEGYRRLYELLKEGKGAESFPGMDELFSKIDALLGAPA